MREIGKKFKIGCLIFVFVFMFLPQVLDIVFEALDTWADSEENITLADGFTIEKYNVVLDVNEDNKVDVTENLTVNFTSPYKHGIYKFTPEWLEYTGLDNKTIKRKSKVLNYKAIGDEYTVDTVKKKKRIKIGSAYEYVGEGEKTYVIKYTYDMGKDPFDDFDEFIFHAFGDYWGTEIKNASIEVHMPENINADDVNFFMDKYRKENVNDLMDIEVSGNTLKASYKGGNYSAELQEFCSINAYKENPECNALYRSLTVDIALKEGYFKGGSYNYGFGSLLISILILSLTGYTIYKWFKFGKNYKKEVQTIEFYPPDNLNSAEIGYVYNKSQSNKKLTISLIIQLASKGYIKIDDIKDDVKITNLVIKPKDLKSFEDTLEKRTIEVKKLKDIDDNLSKQETSMMKYLFKKGDTKKLKANIDKFLKVRDNLVNLGYIEIVSDNEASRLENLEEKKKAYEESAQNYEEAIEKYNEIISKMPPLTDMEKAVYDKLFVSSDEVILSQHKTFYEVFSTIDMMLKDTFKDKVYDKVSNKQKWYAIFRTIIIAILSVIAYFVIEDLDPKLNFVYVLNFICIPINIIFTIIMGRKTKYGEKITARVNGFREFLIKVEKEKLEELVLEDSRYFYNILPYSYVLNVSKKWVKKFENIKFPEVDMGNFDYNDSSVYYSIYDHVYYPSSSSSSSGCSSCGGGCSSCGGGCSSCGGGGSW